MPLFEAKLQKLFYFLVALKDYERFFVLRRMPVIPAIIPVPTIALELCDFGIAPLTIQ
jgi:hypothetical protein